MLQRFCQSGLVLLSVFTLAVLFLLVSLGNWQWQRKVWKEGVIGQLKIAAMNEPLPVDLLKPRDDGTGFGVRATGSASRGRSGTRIALAKYTPVTITGRFHHDQEAYVFWTRGVAVGYLVFTPMTTESGLRIFVNRGFVPTKLKSPETRAEGQTKGLVSVKGVLIRRFNKTGLFTPQADLTSRTWYAILPKEMAVVVAEKSGLSVLTTYTIEANEAANPGGWPKGRSIAQRISDIPNRHLGYAVTWWGLALTLLGVYAAFVFSRLRARTGEH